jgi:hypothetical protein
MQKVGNERMVFPVPSQTFSMADPRDLYVKLLYEIKWLEETPNWDQTRQAYIALNGAITAWHMAEWLAAGLTPAQKAKLSKFAGTKIDSAASVMQYARKSSPALHVCRQIATGAKHVEVTEYHDPKVTAQLEGHVERTEHGADLYVRLWVRDGTREWSPEELLEEASLFWRAALIAVDLYPSDEAFKSKTRKLPTGGAEI